jgi:hypothetical protein
MATCGEAADGLLVPFLSSGKARILECPAIWPHSTYNLTPILIGTVQTRSGYDDFTRKPVGHFVDV